MLRLIGSTLLLLVGGCLSSDCFISPTATPRPGERYKLYFRTLEIVQVVDKEVHVRHHTGNGLRVCVLPLFNDYVTGAYLRPGVYEYVGPYTYHVIKDGRGNDERTHTVRLFKEVEPSQ